jgi:hypothetical protein
MVLSQPPSRDTVPLKLQVHQASVQDIVLGLKYD